MDYASQPLSQELYEATGWSDTQYCYYSNGGEVNGDIVHDRSWVFDKPGNVPAYTIGYLLDKLPSAIAPARKKGLSRSLTLKATGELWYAGYDHRESRFRVEVWAADNPADALAKLAIELKKQGIL